MPKWFKTVTDVLAYPHTWIGVLGAAGTIWGWLTSYLAGLPAQDIALRTGTAFALFMGGALFMTKVIDWIKDEIGPRRNVKNLTKIMSELSKRRHTDILLRDLAEYWAGTVREKGNHESWARWNVRFRDLKDATDGRLLTQSGEPRPHANMDAKVTIESALKFFQSNEWRRFG